MGTKYVVLEVETCPFSAHKYGHIVLNVWALICGHYMGTINDTK